ncbi:hypothetical protein [Vibrio metschnikovii]|uniref:hypothetical protein n=1 Tax=Vibrio metschnikovii TaxID=28172 RepID=UPI002FC5F71B
MKREKKKSSGSTETSCENQDIDHFLDLLEKDIEQHPSKLIVHSQEVKEELDEIVSDYSRLLGMRMV